MIARILAMILGTNNARQLRKIQPIVDKINALEPGISALSDESLAAKTVEFRERLAKGEELDEIFDKVILELSKQQELSAKDTLQKEVMLDSVIKSENNLWPHKTKWDMTIDHTNNPS